MLTSYTADGYIMSHEWTLYVFDAAMMVGVLAVSLRTYGLLKGNPVHRKLVQRHDGSSLESLPELQRA